MTDSITIKDDEIIDIDPPITAYISHADRRRLLVAMDAMRRLITEDGAIFDSKYPWIRFYAAKEELLKELMNV